MLSEMTKPYRYRFINTCVWLFPALIWTFQPLPAGEQPSPRQIAAAVDKSLWSEDIEDRVPLCDDSTWLRRVMLDIVGRTATPGEITAFGLDPSETRREDLVKTLLQSPDYGKNWAGYWRDAIFLRATNQRAPIVRAAFVEWMTGKLNEGTGWDRIAEEMITVTGPVNNNGATALLFAHEGVAEEVAAEVSRLFLGIQIQCANCHDHPWDGWKREQFHQFTAFFPRVSVQRDRNSDNNFDFEIASMNADRGRFFQLSPILMKRMDRDNDGAISADEAKGTPLERLFSGQALAIVDRNSDGRVTMEEMRTAQPPQRPGQGIAEHFMPDLADPGAQGKQTDPAFFLSSVSLTSGMDDLERRRKAAELITQGSHGWFAKAIVNRVWFELMGTAFYQPVDDIGPERECQHEETLRVLSQGFEQSGYDLKWLMTTITLSRTYQRLSNPTAEGFARCEPMRLRSDQYYRALCQSLGVDRLPMPITMIRRPNATAENDAGLDEFGKIFGFDPSTPRDELQGSVPEALFMMNSQILDRIIRTPGENGVIGQIATTVLADEDIIRELYLRTLGREPSTGELTVAMQYLQDSAGVRIGLEDLLWALINSPEFATRP